MQPSTKWQFWIVFVGLVAVGCVGVVSDDNGIGVRPTTGQGGAPGTGGSIGIPTGGNVGPDAGGPGPSGSGGSIGGTSSGSSAYCDLQQMLRTRCDGCHSNPPVSGAPMPLVTYADLLAPARSNPARIVADVALERMQDPVRPMPPAPAPHATAAEVSILSNWIAAGSPVVCTSSPPATGTGTAGAGGAGPGVDAGGPTGTGGSSGGITGDAGTSTALCSLQQTLRTRCVSCHSNPPVNGAPMPLITYADLIAPARSNPARRVADVALTRMQDPVSPMPPAPAPRATAAEIGTLSNWIAAGSPAVCIPGTGGTDAGGVTGNPPPPPPPPPVVCTSGQRWTGGNTGSPLMHPGVACLSCHSGTGGGGEDGDEAPPLWTIAGTVYPTVREPNDCNGVNGTTAGVQVIVTDAAGRVLTLPVNTSGNFYTNAAVTFPFHARVVRGGVVRMMTAAQSSGNCNGCHTQDGANGAPGRIVVP